MFQIKILKKLNEYRKKMWWKPRNEIIRNCEEQHEINHFRKELHKCWSFMNETSIVIYVSNKEELSEIKQES